MGGCAGSDGGRERASGERPVICIGQDEAIFKQCVFTNKVWQHNGQKRLMPKDEGVGGCVMMSSAFQSRESLGSDALLLRKTSML